MKAYQDYKDSGIAGLISIPNHWSRAKLKFVGKIRYGLGQPPKELENGIPIIRATNVERGRIVDKDMLYVDPSDVPTGRGAFLKENEIIVVRSGAYTADSAIVTRKYLGAVAGYDMVITPTEINARLLSYALLSHYVLNNQLYLERMRAAQPHLNAEELGETNVVIPSLPEQQAVIDFLDCKTSQIDTLIEKKQRQIDLLQEQRTALINHVVTKGLNPDAPMKDSGVEWLGEIPRHWEVKKLKYVGQAVIGLTYNPENITDEENGTLVLRASNVYGGRIVFDDNVFVKMEIPERLITKVGDILICVRSGSRDLIGKNALIDEKSAGHAFGAFMTVFRSDINYFLSYVFKSQLFKVQSGLFNTSTVNQLTQGNLYSFQIPVPPINEQKDIIQFLSKELSKVDETTNRVAKQIELLLEYRTALISEAVTGKIDVREWQKKT